MDNKYTYSIHPSGYITIKNLLDSTVAVIDFDEKLSFTHAASDVEKQEVKDFLNENDIPFFL